MIDIQRWMEQYCRNVRKMFGARVRFVGLQGSFARGQAREGSDIDAVLILDVFTMEDLCAYRRFLDAMPHRARTCGFVCGVEELQGWSRADLFQLYYDTRAWYGSLEEMIPPFTREEAREAARMGAGNLYHGCCHSMLHGVPEKSFPSMCKAAYFVLQAVCFARTGTYPGSQEEMRAGCRPEELEILAMAESRGNGAEAASGMMKLAGFAGSVLRQEA